MLLNNGATPNYDISDEQFFHDFPGHFFSDHMFLFWPLSVNTITRKGMGKFSWNLGQSTKKLLGFLKD